MRFTYYSTHENRFIIEIDASSLIYTFKCANGTGYNIKIYDEDDILLDTITMSSGSSVNITLNRTGVQILKISGLTTQWNFQPLFNNNQYLKKILQWGNEIQPGMGFLNYAPNVTIIPNETPSSGFTNNLSGMFAGASSFNSLINNWDVSNVTNMRDMFNSNPVFNQPLNNWDVSNVTDMNFMFSDATNFNQNLSGWCVTNIPSTPFEFSSGSSLTGPNTPIWGTCP